MDPIPMRRHTHRNPVPLLSLAAVLLFGVLFVQIVWGSDADEVPTPSGPILDQQTFLQNVAVGDASDQADSDAMAASQSGPWASKDSNAYAPPSSFTENPPTGIITDFSVPGGWAVKYRVLNKWRELVGGVEAVVNAGSKADDQINGVWNNPEQGVLVIDLAEYLTPTRTGAVRVTSAYGTCLTLTSTNGTIYDFDVQTRNWLCEPPGPPEWRPPPGP